MWPRSDSSLMTRVSAFASDLIVFIEKKDTMSRFDKQEAIALLRREFEHFLLQDPHVLKEMEQKEEFGQ